MISIDGAYGEGGGQIVRSSLALSLVTGKAVQIRNIRARRRRPGLRQQHLTAVRAATQISGASISGAEIGSSSVSFEPGSITPGEYAFRVGTAGSTTLVLQTVLPALLLANGSSQLFLEGGTHNPFAPPFEFLAKAYLPLVNRMGPSVQAALHQPGFYPAGGGRMTVTVQPADVLKGFDLHERGEIVRRSARAIVANLPEHIARRECETIARKSRWRASCFETEFRDDAIGPGNVVIVEVESKHLAEVFTAFGRQGVAAERVAAHVWRETKDYLDADVPVGTHLADQLILPLGIAASQGSGGSFRTMALTDHATTHLEVLQHFLDVKTSIKPSEGGNLVNFDR